MNINHSYFPLPLQTVHTIKIKLTLNRLTFKFSGPPSNTSFWLFKLIEFINSNTRASSSVIRSSWPVHLDSSTSWWIRRTVNRTMLVINTIWNQNGNINFSFLFVLVNVGGGNLIDTKSDFILEFWQNQNKLMQNLRYVNRQHSSTTDWLIMSKIESNFCTKLNNHASTISFANNILHHKIRQNFSNMHICTYIYIYIFM